MGNLQKMHKGQILHYCLCKTVTITKGLMSFFHFRPKFPHHSGQLSCHTDACTYNQWSRLGHGRQLHTPLTHLLISSPLMEYSQLPPVPTHYPYILRSFTNISTGSDQGTLHII